MDNNKKSNPATVEQIRQAQITMGQYTDKQVNELQIQLSELQAEFNEKIRQSAIPTLPKVVEEFDYRQTVGGFSKSSDLFKLQSYAGKNPAETLTVNKQGTDVAVSVIQVDTKAIYYNLDTAFANQEEVVREFFNFIGAEVYNKWIDSEGNFNITREGKQDANGNIVDFYLYIQFNINDWKSFRGHNSMPNARTELKNAVEQFKTIYISDDGTNLNARNGESLLDLRKRNVLTAIGRDGEYRLYIQQYYAVLLFNAMKDGHFVLRSFNRGRIDKKKYNSALDILYYLENNSARNYNAKDANEQAHRVRFKTLLDVIGIDAESANYTNHAKRYNAKIFDTLKHLHETFNIGDYYFIHQKTKEIYQIDELQGVKPKDAINLTLRYNLFETLKRK